MPYPYTTVATVRGTTLLEVLVTIVIVTFGLLGLAGLQGKLVFAEIESYQRAQAVLLMNDMVERITANRSAAPAYVTTGTLGVGASAKLAANLALVSCAATAIGVDRDKCEWSNALKGSSESKSVTAGGVTSQLQTGAMSAARGCIQLIQASDASLGVCAPGIYLVTVAWQGTNKTTAPSATCGQNLYGDDKFRRALSTRVSVGLPSCQ